TAARPRRPPPPPAPPVRAPPAAPVLPAAHRRADGPVAPLGHADPLPVRGRGQLLVGGHWAGRAHRRRVDLPNAAAGKPEDRRAGLLLQRESGHLPGRRAGRTAQNAVQLAARENASASRIPRSTLPPASRAHSPSLQPRPSNSANSAG